MRNDICPTSLLPFEPDHAKTLHWLPLAVRHKLDEAGLKLSLAQWQALSRGVRMDLVRRLADEFSSLAVAAGAYVSDNPRSVGHSMDESEVGRLLGCGTDEARRWIANSSAFARYAMGKRLGLKCP